MKNKLSYETWLSVYNFLESSRHENIFNSKYTFQIAFMIYMSWKNKSEKLITEDVINNTGLTCSDCASRSFIHQLEEMNYVKREPHPNDKRKRVIKCQLKLVSVFE
jgi:hypothetical protein